jgi:membrane protein
LFAAGLIGFGSCAVDLPRGFVSVGRSIMAKTRLPRFIKILAGAQTGAENEFNRLERFAHFWVLVVKSFLRNRCPSRAAALSYSTLLALIPMLAVAISVTSGLLKTQGEEKIYDVVDKVVSNLMPPPATVNPTNGAFEIGPDFSVALSSTNVLAETNSMAATMTNSATVAMENSPRVIDAQKQAAKWIHQFIQNTRSKTLGVVGMLLLLYVAITMLANIESTFNDIWGAARGRSWLLRIVLYWATITLGPLLLIVALGLAGGSQMQTAREFVSHTPLVGEAIFKLLPLVVLWLAFALFYQIVPNTKVRPEAALIGGFVAGSLWHLNNVFGFLYVSRVVSNSQFYGKLGLVPVFMAGLYFSWIILLFGAQVAYAFQNRKSYLQDKLVENVNQRGREFIALRLMTCIGQRFQFGRPPVTIQEISTELGIPTKLAHQVLQTLLAARLVVETNGGEHAYAPARPLDDINAHHILLAMRASGGQELLSRDEPMRAEIFGEFARIEAAEKATASAITLLALVTRAQAHLEIAAPAQKTEKQTSLPVETKVEIVEMPEGKDAAVSNPSKIKISELPKSKTAAAPRRDFFHPEENSPD